MESLVRWLKFYSSLFIKSKLQLMITCKVCWKLQVITKITWKKEVAFIFKDIIIIVKQGIRGCTSSTESWIKSRHGSLGSPTMSVSTKFEGNLIMTANTWILLDQSAARKKVDNQWSMTKCQPSLGSLIMNASTKFQVNPMNDLAGKVHNKWKTRLQWRPFIARFIIANIL